MSDAQRGGRRLHELEDVRRSSGGADAKSVPLSARWFLHICGRDRIWLWRAAGSIACKPAVMAETDERVAFGTEYRALAGSARH